MKSSGGRLGWDGGVARGTAGRSTIYHPRLSLITLAQLLHATAREPVNPSLRNHRRLIAGSPGSQYGL
jgi:hypothetical protein